jgi:hypothetical protein
MMYAYVVERKHVGEEGIRSYIWAMAQKKESGGLTSMDLRKNFYWGTSPEQNTSPRTQ